MRFIRRPPGVNVCLKIPAILHQRFAAEEHVHHTGALGLVDDIEIPVPQGGLDGLPGEQVGDLFIVAADVINVGGGVLVLRLQLHIFQQVAPVFPDHFLFQPLAALEQNGPVLGGIVDLPGGVVQIRDLHLA